MFRVAHLELHALTEFEHYSAALPLKPGVNIIQAGNTSGKSTCLQAMIYGLGLERMWGPRVGVPLAHAMQSRIQKIKHGEFASVIQSWVELVIENVDGEALRVHRDVVGGKDIRLVRTYRLVDGSIQDQRDFFVNIEGSAQREDGFHAFLARFMGLDLPRVPRFNGSECPLYLEALFPMFFVEQKRGWSVIQGPFPTHLQIQDIVRRVMEFLLDLDIAVARRELTEVKQRLRKVRERWTEKCALLRGAVARGAFVDVPPLPTAEFAERGRIAVTISEGEAWRSLSEAEEAVRSKFADHSSQEVPTSDVAAAESERRLGEVASELEVLDSQLTLESIEINALRLEKGAIDERLETLRKDLQRHQDAIRLQEMGSTLGSTVADGNCPTCHQAMVAELLPSQPGMTMALEENVAFLRAQLRLHESNLAGLEREFRERLARMEGIKARMSELRHEMRVMKQALMQSSGAPSRAFIAEGLRLEADLEELRATRDAVDTATEELLTLAREHVRLEAHQKRLLNERETPQDNAKIAALQGDLRARLERYGFASLQTDEVVLAEDNFRPAMEERDGDAVVRREIGLNQSASDQVRLKWAYLLALMHVAREYRTNHPGILILDEPRQQEAELPSMEALLQSLGEEIGTDQQVIVATSQPREEVEASVSGFPVNILSFDGFILQAEGQER